MRSRNSRRTKVSNIVYFRNKKINYDKKVRDFYIEDGIAYVSCNITGYHDIIDPYSVKGYEWLNSEFTRFVEENCNNIPTEYPILLEICGGDLSERQKETIENTIKQYYQLKLGDIQEQYDDTRRRARLMLVMSILFYFIDALTYHILSILPESIFLNAYADIIQILFWFLLWSDCDIFFLQLTDARWEKTYAAQMASMQIIYRKRFRDEPVAEELREEILEHVFAEEPEEESEEASEEEPSKTGFFDISL